MFLSSDYGQVIAKTESSGCYIHCLSKKTDMCIIHFVVVISEILVMCVKLMNFNWLYLNALLFTKSYVDETILPSGQT